MLDPKYAKYWIPVALWTILIFWMSTATFSAKNTSLIIEPLLRFFMPDLPFEQIKSIHGLIRKIGHLAEYFILGILVFRGFRGVSPRPVILKSIFCTILVLVTYAISDEFHQTFVSSRTPSAIDVCIDTAGGILGQLAIAIWHGRSLK